MKAKLDSHKQKQQEAKDKLARQSEAHAAKMTKKQDELQTNTRNDEEQR